MSFLPQAPDAEALRAKLGAKYPWIVLLVIAGGGGASALTSTTFTVAIPAMMRDFSIGHDMAQLTVSAYMAVMTIAMLPAAWLFDRFGLRRCFLHAVSFMLVVSILGAFSSSFGFLVTIRMAQGLTAGLMGPMGTIAVMRLFAPEAQGRAYGVIGFAVVITPALGPSIGGFLVDDYGWQSIFWLNVPLCILALLAGMYLLPRVAPRIQHGLDRFGLLLLTITTLSVITAATLMHSSGLLSWQVLSAIALGAAAIVTFRSHARRIENPIVSPGILLYPRVVMGGIVAFVYGAGLFGSTYLIPLFLQTVLHCSATRAGLALLPPTAAVAITMLIGGHLVDRGSPRRLVMFGLFLFSLAFLGLWRFAPRVDYMGVIGAVVISRFGLGIQLPALNIGALRGLDSKAMGQATVVINYVRQLGGMLGVASLAVYVEWRGRQLALEGGAVLTAFAEGFLIIGVVFGLALLAANKMHDEPHRPPR